jgi:hypothetical protein
VFATVTNAYDFNRDTSVDADDEIASRFNQGFLLAIQIAGPPAAPEAAASSSDSGADAVATALAAQRLGVGHVGTTVPLRAAASAGAAIRAEPIPRLLDQLPPNVALARAFAGFDPGELPTELDDLLGTLLDELGRA